MKLGISDDQKLSGKCKESFGPHIHQNIAKMNGSCDVSIGDRSQKPQNGGKNKKYMSIFVLYSDWSSVKPHMVTFRDQTTLS